MTTTDSTDRPANRLARETSPYLLQHAHNPVDWHPWGDEAFALAKRLDRPVFLSVGYSACHWCHVMERESFESPEIAAVMNEQFVNIKVDREERPDVDQIYMAAVQALSGHGGWPMSVFLTPDGRPFFGGTYYPPEDSRGMPGFRRVLTSVAKAWAERRTEILDSAGELTKQLQNLGRVAGEPGELTFNLLDNAFRALTRAFDRTHGGFGSAPKFPHPMDLRVLLRHHARTGDELSLEMASHTLDKMARGGIYDHLGGGFARYSTDDRWLVPHFEKMLYDNALLTSTYLEAFQVTRNAEFARVARETLDYVLERMTRPSGGFYSSEDADSEGVEGKFYVWTQAEIEQTLGAERAKEFNYVYDVTEPGNWERRNILNLPKPYAQAAKMLGIDESALSRRLAESRRALKDVRDRRVPPGKDTKILASWNGLMLAALAVGGRVLKDPRYLDAARNAAALVLERMRSPDGRLLHSFKDDRARFNACLDDYACMIDGLTRLFEATGERRWIEAALELAAIMLDEFLDPANGSFFYTGKRHEELISRTKDVFDNATPSGHGMAATALARLGALTSRDDLSEAARRSLAAIHVVLDQMPTAVGQSLIALDFILGPEREFAIVAGKSAAEFEQVLNLIAERFMPDAVVAPAPVGSRNALAGIVPLLADRPAREGQTTTYACKNYTCAAPVIGLAGATAAATAKN